MCGLVGVITEEKQWGKKNRLDTFKEMLVLDSVRGMDSTGVFAPHNTSSRVEMYKALGTGGEFVTSKGFKNMEGWLGNSFAMIGHNRAATQGAVSATNAHPFQCGPVTMVHNGTLRNDECLVHGGMDVHKTPVDSHAVCHNLALAEPTPEGINSVIKTIDGAFALIWWDARTEQLHIVRNDERPLHFVESKHENTLWIMSEAKMLDLVCTRNKIEVFDTMYSVEPGKMLTFAHNSIVPEVNDVELMEAWDSYGGNNYWGYGGYGNAGTGSTKGKGSPRKGRPGMDNKVYVGGKNKEVPKGMQLALAELNLFPEDRLKFKVENIHNTMVGGEVELMDSSKWIARCMGPHHGVVGGTWTVRPIGVNAIRSSDGNLRRVLLVQKVMSSCLPADLYETGEAIKQKVENVTNDMAGEESETGMGFGPADDDVPWWTDDSDPGKTDATAYVVGTGSGMIVDRDGFCDSTVQGCEMCKYVPRPDEYKTLHWFEDDEFVCEDCWPHVQKWVTH